MVIQGSLHPSLRSPAFHFCVPFAASQSCFDSFGLQTCDREKPDISPARSMTIKLAVSLGGPQQLCT